jgi:hypothetical protein
MEDKRSVSPSIPSFLPNRNQAMDPSEKKLGSGHGHHSNCNENRFICKYENYHHHKHKTKKAIKPKNADANPSPTQDLVVIDVKEQQACEQF